MPGIDIVIADVVTDPLVQLFAAAFRNIRILAAVIVIFTTSGTGMIIASAYVTAWPQAFLLGFGIAFFMVGTVELGLLGALKNIIEGKPENPDTAQLNEITATLSNIASHLGVRQDTAGSAGTQASFPQ
jgi:hypothetical protein